MHQIHSKWKVPTGRKRKAITEINRAKSAKRWAREKEGRVIEPSISADLQYNPTPSTSGVKFSYFQAEPISDSVLDVSIESTESDIEDAGEFIIVHKSFWASFVRRLLCPQCKCSNVKVMLQENHGFVKKVISKCLTCEVVINKQYTSPRIQKEAESTSCRPPFLCNRRIVDSFLDIGTGHCGLERFCISMGMDILTLNSYMDHLHKLMDEKKRLQNVILSRSRDAVRKKYLEADPTIDKDEVLDVQVSFDGSWPKRGHTSLSGFASVIETMTGLVIDFVVLSKYCHVCALRTMELDSGPAFNQWKKEHEESGECDINYKGSAGNMEVMGAEIMWKRSIQMNMMQYTTMLSDGDSKVLAHLNNIKPYGKDVNIQKEDCINHVGKRMGTSLRTLVQQEKSRGVTLGGKKAGALTDGTICKLQSYYQKAINECLPDIERAQREIMASLDHMNSTDQKPKHGKCPIGKDSWCFFNRAKAKRENIKSHETMSVKINDEVYKKVKPVLQRLTDKNLLLRCVSLSTQNPNESVHSVIWNKCPKEVFTSRRRYEIGITRGVGEFNMGLSTMTAVRNGGQTASKLAKNVDGRRKDQSSRQSSGTKMRAKKKVETRKQTSKTHKQEGIIYAAGAF